ncbi:MAG: hypothetical protein ACPGVX_03460 [Thalassobaculaceae bacterium]
MFRRHHTPPTAAHGRAARWFWRLMLFGPVLTLLAGYVALWDSLFFPDRVVELPLEGHGWAYSSDQAYQISCGLLLALSCFAIAGINAASLWFAWSARFFALGWSAPIFLDLSNHSMRQAHGCTLYNTPPVSALCQLKTAFNLPFPDMWPLAAPWPFG